MMRNIEWRLQKLESQVPPPQPPQPTENEKFIKCLQWFLIYAIAYYLGNPTPGGSIAEAYSRALGYSHGLEFEKALKAQDPDLFARDRLARVKLLEKFGVSWEDKWEEIANTFDRMEAGFSERYKAMTKEIMHGCGVNLP
jgi:hypothetical protein